MGKIEPEVSGFKSLFFGGGGGGAEVANSYKHVFGRDGRVLKEEIQHYKKRSGYSYGTRATTCICYSYGSPKIS